jgi:hypothetical protein
VEAHPEANRQTCRGAVVLWVDVGQVGLLRATIVATWGVCRRRASST